MLVGYTRVSTQEQNLDRQIDALVNYGVDKRNIYAEKITGTKRSREQLDILIDELQKGDVVVITDITRLSRSTKDLLIIIDEIKEKGASIKSLKDTWLDTNSDNPYSTFLLTIMSGFSQLERDLISVRTKEGLEAAKKRGRKNGRPSVKNGKEDLVLTLYNQNYKIADICKHAGISRTSVYRILNSAKESTKGSRKGGRPNVINDKVDLVLTLYNQNYKIEDICEYSGISSASVYRIINSAKESSKK